MVVVTAGWRKVFRTGREEHYLVIGHFNVVCLTLTPLIIQEGYDPLHDYHRQVTCGNAKCGKPFGFFLCTVSDRRMKEVNSAIFCNNVELIFDFALWLTSLFPTGSGWTQRGPSTQNERSQGKEKVVRLFCDYWTAVPLEDSISQNIHTNRRQDRANRRDGGDGGDYQGQALQELLFCNGLVEECPRCGASMEEGEGQCRWYWNLKTLCYI